MPELTWAPKARVALHDQHVAKQNLADRMARGIGSWRFIIVQTVLVAVWVTVNITGILFQWDPYPFILLNLMFSVQAAYTGPILLLASNRQAMLDRQMAERDDKELFLIHEVQTEQNRLLKGLDKLQKEQMSAHKKQLDYLAKLAGE